MIIDGNYKWLDFESLKPKIIDTQVEYYGEQYRKSITKSINNAKYNGYHKFDYVNEYYKRYILKFRDEILDEFFKESKFESTKERREALISSDTDYLDNSTISLITGAECKDFFFDLYKNKDDGKLRNFSKQKNLFKLFDIELDTPENFKKNVGYIIDAYKKALRKVEKNHPCDVFKDFEIIENNYNRDIAEFFEVAKKYGYIISDNDKNLIEQFKSGKISLFDNMYKLDCGRELYDGELGIPGLVTFFTSEAEKLVKENKNTDKYDVYVNRLRYLFNKGAKLEVLTKEELFDYQPYNANKEIKNKILQEYKIQKINNAKLFISPEDADMIETNRQKFALQEYDGCEFIKGIRVPCAQGYVDDKKSMDNSAFVTYGVVRNIFRREKVIYFDEGSTDNMESLIINMLHECNHVTAEQIIVKNKREAIFREGLDVVRADIKYGNLFKFITAQDDLKLLSENVNDRQANEHYEIYTQNFGTEGFFTGDIIINDKKYLPVYRYADFLTNEFYSLFQEELKQYTVDPNYDYYFRSDYYKDFKEYVWARIKNSAHKHFNSKEFYTNGNGTVDFQNTLDLGALVKQWLENHMTYLYDNEITPEELVTGDCIRKMTGGGYREYLKFRAKKDQIMARINKDLDKMNKYYEDEECGYVLDNDANLKIKDVLEEYNEDCDVNNM